VSNVVAWIDIFCFGWMVSPSVPEIHSAANHNISKMEAVCSERVFVPTKLHGVISRRIWLWAVTVVETPSLNDIAFVVVVTCQ
jgi:hypothetical protein